MFTLYFTRLIHERNNGPTDGQTLQLVHDINRGNSNRIEIHPGPGSLGNTEATRGFRGFHHYQGRYRRSVLDGSGRVYLQRRPTSLLSSHRQIAPSGSPECSRRFRW